MRKPKIKITLVDRIGKHGCHHGHKIGDTFDYDTERGKLCPNNTSTGSKTVSLSSQIISCYKQRIEKPPFSI